MVDSVRCSFHSFLPSFLPSFLLPSFFLLLLPSSFFLLPSFLLLESDTIGDAMRRLTGTLEPLNNPLRDAVETNGHVIIKAPRYLGSRNAAGARVSCWMEDEIVVVYGPGCDPATFPILARVGWW